MNEVDFVASVVTALTGDEHCYEVDRRADDKGVLLTLYIDSQHMGRVIGREGVTANALRSLLWALGTRNNAKYGLKIYKRDD